MNKKQEWILNYLTKKGSDNILNQGFIDAYTNEFYSEEAEFRSIRDLGKQLSKLYKINKVHRSRYGLEYYHGQPKWYYEYEILK